MFRSFLQSFRELRRFKSLPAKAKEIIFYAESESYLPYLQPFMEELENNYDRKLVYVTSSREDPLLSNCPRHKLKTFCITHETVRTIFFSSLDAKILVMSLLDLGRFHIKRSFFPVHYVFVPHNVNSTHMVFRKGAHNNFDTIFCVGPHHYRELRKAEELYNLPRRSLVKNGYARFDILWRQLKALEVQSDALGNTSTSCTRVLFAPSWDATACLFQIGGEKLISKLVESGFALTIRPHRHITQKTKRVLEEIREKFSNSPEVCWSDGSNPAKLYSETDVLITDWSGSAFSYAFATERPVLFINTPMKVRNPDYKDYQLDAFEQASRPFLGVVLELDELSQIPEMIRMLHTQREEFRKKIVGIRDEHIYHLGNSARLGAEHLDQLTGELTDAKV